MFRKQKETFEFKSTNPAPSQPELKEFEDSLLELIKNVEFTNKTNNLQEKMKQDIKNMKSENKVFLPADKITNYYKTEVNEYNKPLESIVVKQLIKEQQKIVKELFIENRVFKTVEREAFVIIKDNFQNNPKCRLR